jgi:hypothetical protein
MHPRLSIVLTGLLLAFSARSALANDQGFVLWDQNIASAVSAGLPNTGRCANSPYALYSPGCDDTLNLSFGRPINYFSFLDRAALFLHKYHELKYNQSLWDNANYDSMLISKTCTSRRPAPASSCASASPVLRCAPAC